MFLVINLMNLKVIPFLMLFLLVLPLATATQDFFGTRKIGECINLPQTCSPCTYENITGIEYPNGTFIIITGNQSMQKIGTINYNYTYCFPDLIGDYWIYGHDDETGIDQEWEYKLTLTYNGEQVSLSNIILPVVFLIMSGLLLVVGFVFSSEHWLLRSFFNFTAIGMGLLAINSGKIIANESANLGKMGTVGITIMITILAIFFIYMFVYTFIEIIKALREKKGVRWKYT